MTSHNYRAFASFDREAVEAIPINHQLIREYLINACGWSDLDGDLPGHFRHYPGGHRCLWSARWATANGLISPDDCWGLDSMTSQELILEAVDLAYRSGGDTLVSARILPLVLDYYTGTVGNPAYFLEQLRDGIRQARRGYPDYTFVDPSGMSGGGYRLMQLIVRPGWGTKEEILEKAKAK